MRCGRTLSAWSVLYPLFVSLVERQVFEAVDCYPKPRLTTSRRLMKAELCLSFVLYSGSDPCGRPTRLKGRLKAKPTILIRGVLEKGVTEQNELIIR